MDQTVITAPVLTVRGLTKRFGGLTAVKNLAFELRPGEILGLIGPNGSGKSTAMKSVMGIERPTAGEVIFEGQNVAGLPAHRIARKGFGMVFQHSRPLNRQTVLENIMVALLPDSLFMLFPDKALTERAKWIAARVGLGAVMDRASADPAVRRFTSVGARESNRTRSQGRAGRRAVRRPDASRGRHVLRTDPQLPRRRARGDAGRP